MNARGRVRRPRGCLSPQGHAAQARPARLAAAFRVRADAPLTIPAYVPLALIGAEATADGLALAIRGAARDMQAVLPSPGVGRPPPVGIDNTAYPAAVPSVILPRPFVVAATRGHVAGPFGIDTEAARAGPVAPPPSRRTAPARRVSAATGTASAAAVAATATFPAKPTFPPVSAAGLHWRIVFCASWSNPGSVGASEYRPSLEPAPRSAAPAATVVTTAATQRIDTLIIDISWFPVLVTAEPKRGSFWKR